MSAGEVVSGESSSGEAAKPPRVFVSYSHDSKEHEERVLALADRLRSDGIDARLDQYELEPEAGWERWMVDEIEAADRVLAVCTETYRRRFEGKEEKGGLGVRWEGAILTDKLYHREGPEVSPVVFAQGDLVHLPVVLRKGATFHVVADERGYELLYRVLTNQPATPARPLGKRKALPPRPRLSAFGAPGVPPAGPEPEESAAVAEYRAWALERYGTLDLLGLGAGDLRVDLDRIYVPLRIHDRPVEEVEVAADKRGREAQLEGWLGAGANRAVELDRLFVLPGAAPERRHALIFGAAGSGKTTALKKLHQLALDGDPRVLGLAPGTLPVFLRLRRFTPELLARGLEAFIAAELEELSGGRLPEGLGAELWQRRRLLLLFDGLDEIADEGHRAKVLERIVWWLGEPELAEVRAVVSGRYAGWTKTMREQRFDGSERFDGFYRLDVKPFDDEQIARLIELWFREVGRAGYLEPGLAAERAQDLIHALTAKELRRQDFLKLVSTPLLATLLCLVVMRGGEIPRRRVEFYEECLRVLVHEWRRRQTRRDAPVPPERALRLLGELAWKLHSEHRRDDLTYPQALTLFKGSLGDGRLAAMVFGWLLDEVAVLELYTDQHYGFAHLGFQEHLAARHVDDRRAAGDEEPLDRVCGEWQDSWWREVIQLLAGLPKGRSFGPLLGRLLAGEALMQRTDLLAACLAEASDPDLEPFYRLLRGTAAPERKVAALGLLRGRSEAELLELAAELQAGELRAGKLSALKAMAGQVLERASAPAAGGHAEVFLLHGPHDHRPATRLAAALARHGVEVDRPKAGESWTSRGAVDRLLACPRLLVLLGEEPFEEDALEELLALAEGGALLLSLPGDPRPARPQAFRELPHVDLPSFDDAPALAALAARLRAVELPPDPAAEVAVERVATRGAASPAPSVGDEAVQEGTEFTEPLTAELFLPVPAGSFEMGATDITDEEQPIHRVRLSAFWLARTPVTNRQYQLFLTATGHEEPSYWRDERFSGPEQPVVGVTWHDAVAYCEWLSRESPLGLVFTLPTEAQWEYAARGTDGREFPWGNRDPDPELATFDLDPSTGKPSPVGSHPAGAGPFGHLDLAGNVWEWCRDLWESDYSRWREGEALDPIGKADANRRPLRGGAWWNVALLLRSAYRNWVRPGYRYDLVGFRVSCSSSSTVP